MSGCWRRHVCGFGDVFDKVVKLGVLDLAPLVGDGYAAVPAGLAAQGAVGVRQLQLPAAVAGDTDCSWLAS